MAELELNLGSAVNGGVRSEYNLRRPRYLTRPPLVVTNAALSSHVLYPDKSERKEYDHDDDRDQHTSEHSHRSCDYEKQRAEEEKS